MNVKKERLERNKYKLKIDVIQCNICGSIYIKLSEIEELNCSKCKSYYNIHLLGEIILFDKKDYYELLKKGKLRVTKSLMMKYNIRY